MKVTCFYDYTCVYSYRAWRWLDALATAIPVLEVSWAPFSLREINRPPDEPSLFEDESSGRISVFALALAHAAREADFDSYHRTVFGLMHQKHVRLRREDLLEVAAESGVDTGAFERDTARWVAAVAAEHSNGRDRWEVFGTPTLVLADESAVYLKLAEIPQAEQAEELWRALWTISVTHPELVEIKRPH